jgi:sterol desaturase/sphingolipid hydroxylase (fatty acid hydroxylase superfamily)
MSIPLVVLAVALVMMAWEALVPGRRWPDVRGWWARALLLNVLQAAAVFLGGVTWDGWMRRHRLWSTNGLGDIMGTVIGYLAITFVYYWWHRARHVSPLLWRWLHQVHHSAQRIEVVTSFYKHPLEVALNGVLSSAILYLLVGLAPGPATAAVLLTGLAELFYHWNVATPHWLGYLFQRPESHCVHHEEGRHAGNYSDLPLWDILFGTFHNPKRWDGRCGLGAENEVRLAEMLVGRDVSSPSVG